MGFLDSLKKVLGGSTGSGGARKRTGSGDESWTHWVYARCKQCGEPLRARIDLRNDLSRDDDGTLLVRKWLMGSGSNYCFQTVEVTLRFDENRKRVVSSDAVGGTLITADEYEALLQEQADARQEAAAEQGSAEE